MEFTEDGVYSSMERGRCVFRVSCIGSDGSGKVVSLVYI